MKGRGCVSTTLSVQNQVEAGSDHRLMTSELDFTDAIGNFWGIWGNKVVFQSLWTESEKIFKWEKSGWRIPGGISLTGVLRCRRACPRGFPLKVAPWLWTQVFRVLPSGQEQDRMWSAGEAAAGVQWKMVGFLLFKNPVFREWCGRPFWWYLKWRIQNYLPCWLLTMTFIFLWRLLLGYVFYILKAL